MYKLAKQSDCGGRALAEDQTCYCLTIGPAVCEDPKECVGHNHVQLQVSSSGVLKC